MKPPVSVFVFYKRTDSHTTKRTCQSRCVKKIYTNCKYRKAHQRYHTFFYLCYNLSQIKNEQIYNKLDDTNRATLMFVRTKHT